MRGRHLDEKVVVTIGGEIHARCWRKTVSRLKQLFKNRSNASIILFLEPTTARFRLMPGDEMTLFYNHDAATDGIGAPLRIEYMLDGDEPMIVIYTFEDTMFLPDGTEVERDYS